MPSVLIVDDELGARELLKRWLAGSEYTVLEADAAEAAVTVLEQSPVDVVIADMRMPGLGGAWLLSQVRERFGTTPVVLATADANLPGTISLQRGVVGYIVKPFTRDALLTQLAIAMAWRQQQIAAGPSATVADPVDSFLDRKLTGRLPPGDRND